MKRSLLRLTLLFLLVGTAGAFAQTVTGKVTSAGDGNPMPGVSILLKGTSSGTSTDVDGKFSLNVSDPTNAVLVISFIGYATQEVAIQSRTTVDVLMNEDVSQLNEVVVTALGVQRETKTLVYATQTVKPQQLTEVRDANNVLNSFAGKIANVQINQGSGGPGSGARIVMRGNRSIQGSNNALIVVDGVPINNNTNSAANNDFGSVQSSDGASNINPDDIESVTVLRGASAAALYGSQAGNGVIVITTKKGTKDKITVNVNSGIVAENAFVLPKVQNTYGQGQGGVLDGSSARSWGARMDGTPYTNYLGQARNYSPQPDNIKDFFRTGVSLNNSIGVQGGSEKMQTYLSYTNKKSQGIVPKNDLMSHTLNLRLSNQISKKLSTDAKVTYINQVIKGRPRTGEENAAVIDMYQTPRNVALSDVKNFEYTNNTGLPRPTNWPATLPSIYQNPYWMVNRTSIDQNRNRVMGFVTAKYQITNNIDITGRANLDRTSDLDEQKYSDTTKLWANQKGGKYEQNRTNITQQWYDVTLSGKQTITSDLKMDYRVGAIYFDNLYQSDIATADGLYIPNKFSMGFGSAVSGDSKNTNEVQTQSVFAQASFAYKEFLFLEASFRNDWDSRLPSPYSVPYPSVGLSGIISEMVTMPQAISFLKLNANYAQVGNGGKPQIRTNTYEFQQGAGNGFLKRSDTESIPGIKFEIVSNVELGLDARFLDNRLGFTFTYYKSNSKNQLLKIQQPVATGYAFKYINAGDIQNQGIELVLNATPVKSNIVWDVNFNLGMNRNKIKELTPDLKQTFLADNADFARTATPIVQVGGSFGDLVSRHWQRDANGNFVVDATTGLPVATANPPTYLGRTTPDATLGLTNTVNYKNFSLRVLVDGRVGGIIIDGTEMNLAFDGISDVTAKNREEAWSLGGVDATGKPVNQAVTAQQFWTSVSGKRYGTGEFFAYSATNFRVREISIGYNIPVPANFFIKSARFSLVARNVAWLYRGSSLLDIPGLGKRKMQIDPDMSMGNGNWQGVQIGTIPSTRSLGCNLNLTF